MTNICGVFITLANDKSVKGIQRACDEKIKVLGEEIELKKAKEPSDYIWENMGYTAKRQAVFFWIIMLVLGIIIIFSYIIQLKLVKAANDVDKYEQFDCKVYTNQNREFDREVY